MSCSSTLKTAEKGLQVCPSAFTHRYVTQPCLVDTLKPVGRHFRLPGYDPYGDFVMLPIEKTSSKRKPRKASSSTCSIPQKAVSFYNRTGSKHRQGTMIRNLQTQPLGCIFFLNIRGTSTGAPVSLSVSLRFCVSSGLCVCRSVCTTK